MHKLATYFFFATFFLLHFFVKSQNNSDTISMIKKDGRFLYYKNDVVLSKEQLKNLLIENNTIAFYLMEQSNNRRVTSCIFGFAGGVSLGYSFVYLLDRLQNKKNMNPKLFYPFLGAGLGLIVIGIDFGISANNKAREAIAAYNRSKRQKNNSTSLNLGFSPGGVLLKLDF